MNTQLVDSIVQMVENLLPAERDLVKHKLLDTISPQELTEHRIYANANELTLDERRAFLRQPLAARRSVLAKQADEMFAYYQSSNEWRELMAGDIIDD